MLVLTSVALWEGLHVLVAIIALDAKKTQLAGIAAVVAVLGLFVTGPLAAGASRTLHANQQHAPAPTAPTHCVIVSGGANTCPGG